MKAIKFKESEYYSVTLPNYGTFLVDGKYVEVASYHTKVQVKDVHNIIPVSRQKSIVNYVMHDNNGNLKSISPEKYVETELALLAKKVPGTYEDDVQKWATLEDEFEYRKFKELWKPTYKDIEMHGNPYAVTIEEAALTTDNPYISSEYINGGDDPLLFIYNRKKAFVDLVTEKFTSLGMEFKGDIGEKMTAYDKVWGRSDHSGVRFAKAFGKYCFNDTFDIKSNPRGSLDKLVKMYEDDKALIDKTIQSQYTAHFGRIMVREVDFKEITALLKRCTHTHGKICPMQKSREDYRLLGENLQGLTKLIESYLTK